MNATSLITRPGLVPGTQIPEHRPGEPPLPDHGAAALALAGLRRLGWIAIMLPVALPLWPLYLVIRLFRPRPPHIPAAGRFARYLRDAADPAISAPGLSGPLRAFIFLALLGRWLVAVLPALAWYLDELLYGRKLRGVELDRPLFELSAARSGSTQLAHYLEDDPAIRCPSVLHELFPYLWLWKIARVAGPRLITAEKVRARVLASLPPAFVQRHEMDPFRTDTFEVMFTGFHLGDIAYRFGGDRMAADFGTGSIQPENRALWEEDFVEFVDGLLRKTRLLHGEGRVMIKGHFLAAAPALARRYPDARFLTVLRTPEKRLQSMVNFHRAQPGDPVLGPVPWSSIVELVIINEVDYCDAELRWFGLDDGVRRCVVRFDDYVRDLEGTMKLVYRELMDRDEVPVHVPKVHAPRQRTHYDVDRSLADLGIDTAWLEQRLADYRAWCTRRAPGRAGD